MRNLFTGSNLSMGIIDERLAAADISLPDAAAPVANYVPWSVTGSLVLISGQLPIKDGTPQYVGHVGASVSLDDAAAAARLCGINIVAQLKTACEGNLDRVDRCLKLGGFVSCGSDFTDHPKVINGCSDLMIEIFGEKGRHARFAVGVPSLPLGAAVEIDAMFSIKT